MKSWNMLDLGLEPHAPQILSSTDDARAIGLVIPAGESLEGHQVHERAWVVVLGGEVEVTAAAGKSVAGGTGTVMEFDP